MRLFEGDLAARLKRGGWRAFKMASPHKKAAFGSPFYGPAESRLCRAAGAPPRYWENRSFQIFSRWAIGPPAQMPAGAFGLRALPPDAHAEAVENRCRLAPGRAAAGVQPAVGGAVHQPRAVGPGQRVLGVGGDRRRVGKLAQVRLIGGVVALVDVIAVQEGRQLLAGNGVVRLEQAVAAAVGDVGGGRPLHRVVISRPGGHIPEARAADGGLSLQPVENQHQLAPGDGILGFELVVALAAHQALLADVGDVGGEGVVVRHIGEDHGQYLGHDGEAQVHLGGVHAGLDGEGIVVDIGGQAVPGTDAERGGASGGNGPGGNRADLIAVRIGLLQDEGGFRVVLHRDRLGIDGAVAHLRVAEVQGGDIQAQGVDRFFDDDGGLTSSGRTLPGLEDDAVGIGSGGEGLLGSNLIAGGVVVIQPQILVPHGVDVKMVVALHAVHPHGGGTLIGNLDGDLLLLGILIGIAVGELAQVLAGRVDGDGIALLGNGGGDGNIIRIRAGSIHIGGGYRHGAPGSSGAGGAFHGYGDRRGAALCQRRPVQGGGEAAAGADAEVGHVVIAVVGDHDRIPQAAARLILLQRKAQAGGRAAQRPV